MSGLVGIEYRAYAASEGRTPDAMMETDRDRWPGGLMTGFILWVRQQRRSWGGAPWDVASFHDWLRDRYCPTECEERADTGGQIAMELHTEGGNG